MRINKFNENKDIEKNLISKFNKVYVEKKLRPKVLITQFEIFERKISYEETEEFIRELSKYKSVKITDEEIEFTFDDLAKETGGRCYYVRFMNQLCSHLFMNNIFSYYNLEEKFYKEDEILNLYYWKKNMSDKISLGTGTIIIKIPYGFGIMTDKIDKSKPVTFYIEETKMKKIAKKYNL